MNIDEWMRDRRIRGTLADTARRVLASDMSYQQAEERLRQLYVLEALIAHSGSHEATANALEVHRHTIGRTIKALGLTADDVRKIASRIKEK